MRITYEQLEQWGACKGQRDLAAMHFGRSVVLTRAVLLECTSLKLDLDWLARHILTASALADYRRAGASALADYRRAEASALADYRRAEASALADALGLP